MIPVRDSKPAGWWRRYLQVAGMGVLAISAGCAIESANVDPGPAELEREASETAELEIVDVEVELPIKSIRLSRDRLSLSESLEVTVVVVLPDLCYQLIRLEARVDGDERRVTLRAWGSREGDVCAQVLGMQEEVLWLDSLPSAGLWTVEATHYGDKVEVEFTVTE